MITTFYFRGKILKNKYLTFSYIYKKKRTNFHKQMRIEQ